LQQEGYEPVMTDEHQHTEQGVAFSRMRSRRFFQLKPMAHTKT